jgi:hypothetical protein
MHAPNLQVWQPSSYGGTHKSGKPLLQNCASGGGVKCRRQLVEQVRADCTARIRHLGDLLGRDRVSVNTVAFGPPSEDYAVLQAMAAALPRGSFQVGPASGLGQDWESSMSWPCRGWLEGWG